MGERSDLTRLYIAVDPSKLVQCKWCGTIESDNWRTGRRGGSYCKLSCLHADNRQEYRNLNYGLMILSAGMWLWGWLVGGFLLGVFVGIPMLFMTIPGILCGTYRIKRGEVASVKVPKDSRKPDSLTDLSLLKTIMSHVECPNCDGNIDLTKIGGDQIYHCDYCSASGIVELVHTRDQ